MNLSPSVRIARNVTKWLNTWEEKPTEIIQFEFLASDAVGMTVTTVQTPVVTKRYITGGYQAEYQFYVAYRLKTAQSIDQRLKAVELLNRLGVWATENLPELDGVQAIRCEPTTNAELWGRYDNGDEDYRITFKFIYEVI